jgi:hypothetical protein
MADTRTRHDAAPVSSEPLFALLLASCCVTTLVLVLTDQLAQAATALVAYAAAWAFVRRA